jgi:hypothetical protein
MFRASDIDSHKGRRKGKEQSVETLINGQVIDQATRGGMRVGMVKIILAEVGRGQSDPEVLKQKVIEAFRRGAANV